MNHYNIEKYIDYQFGGNCYSISFENFMIIVDPCVSYENVKKKCHNFKEIKAIFITHGHFDHFNELYSYLINTNAKIYLHKNAIVKLSSSAQNCSALFGNPIKVDSNLINDRVIAISDNVFTIDEIQFESKYFPGHSDCCVSLMFDNNIFVGDFIFKRSVGRTDLYTSSNVMMGLSLKKFKELKLNLFNIYCGHGDNTTFEDEIKYNSYLNRL